MKEEEGAEIFLDFLLARSPLSNIMTEYIPKQLWIPLFLWFCIKIELHYLPLLLWIFLKLAPPRKKESRWCDFFQSLTMRTKFKNNGKIILTWLPGRYTRFYQSIGGFTNQKQLKNYHVLVARQLSSHRGDIQFLMSVSWLSEHPVCIEQTLNETEQFFSGMRLNVQNDMKHSSQIQVFCLNGKRLHCISRGHLVSLTMTFNLIIPSCLRFWSKDIKNLLWKKNVRQTLVTWRFREIKSRISLFDWSWTQLILRMFFFRQTSNWNPKNVVLSKMYRINCERSVNLFCCRESYYEGEIQTYLITHSCFLSISIDCLHDQVSIATFSSKYNKTSC